MLSAYTQATAYSAKSLTMPSTTVRGISTILWLSLLYTIPRGWSVYDPSMVRLATGTRTLRVKMRSCISGVTWLFPQTVKAARQDKWTDQMPVVQSQLLPQTLQTLDY